MKSLVLVLCILAVPLSNGLRAQSSFEEPSEESVLQTARDRYNANSAQPVQPSSQGAANGESQVIVNITNTNQQTTVFVEKTAPAATPAKPDFPYSPFVIAFVPGLSVPFGTYNTNLAAGAIGSAVGELNGIQASGVFSVAEAAVRGVQTAGVFNAANASMRGIQSAGVFNVVDGDFNGIQSAGIFNSTGGRMTGIQSAGIFNHAGSFNGLMASGIINQTGKGRGLMVGLVNVADDLDGVAIGLVNNIKNGVRDIAFDYQFASKMAYVTYRSGTPMLYAVAYVGEHSKQIFSDDNTTRAAGFGLGHRLKVLFLTVDAELAYEIVNVTPNLAALMDLARTGQLPADASALVNEFDSYGSARFSFGFGSRRGSGIYLGIKMDFGDIGPLSVPQHLRYGLNKDMTSGTVAFGREWAVWPKWFVGFKF